MHVPIHLIADLFAVELKEWLNLIWSKVEHFKFVCFLPLDGTVRKRWSLRKESQFQLWHLTWLARCIAPSGSHARSERSIWAPWGPKNARNGPFRACNGKNRIDGCVRTEISVVWPLGIVRIDGKTAPLRPIFAENQFSPADEAVLMGLVVRKCHFDVTACAEARRLAQRAERSSRAGWKTNSCAFQVDDVITTRVYARKEWF